MTRVICKIERYILWFRMLLMSLCTGECQEILSVLMPHLLPPPALKLMLEGPPINASTHHCTLPDNISLSLTFFDNHKMLVWNIHTHWWEVYLIFCKMKVHSYPTLRPSITTIFLFSYTLHVSLCQILSFFYNFKLFLISFRSSMISKLHLYRAVNLINECCVGPCCKYSLSTNFSRSS